MSEIAEQIQLAEETVIAVRQMVEDYVAIKGIVVRQDDKIAQLIKERDALTAEVAQLREALHNISLCSQNSMSSQRQCGEIARAALKETA